MTSNKDKFIENFYIKHQEHLCDLSDIVYINNHTSCEIKCPLFGVKKATPINWLKKDKCVNCQTKFRKKTQNFIEAARKVHKDKYDYSKVNYINNSTKVCIICPTHGEFWQTPDNHINSHKGCPKCKQDKLSKIKTTPYSELVLKMKKIHGDKYVYFAENESKYIDTHHKIKILCPTHGEFLQTPHTHLLGQGCPKCNGGKGLTTQEFIEKAKNKHNNKYDYSKVVYVNNLTKVCIICPIHGEFWQTPHAHLSDCGCPKCNQSHLETEVEKVLQNNNISFIYNKKYDFLNGMQLDFYLTEYNIAIECQGIQHFESNIFFGGEKEFAIIKKRDELKKQLCDKHNIKLLYYSNLHIDYPYKVYENMADIISIVLNST